MNKLGLYLHFPFCIKKCHYCDFLSYEIVDEETYMNYARAMALEINRWKETLSEYVIDTIFLGGGTPSLMTSQSMDFIIKALNQLNLSEDIEFTIEANPKTLDSSKLSYYKSSGINRLSIGVQSLDDQVLQFLGRVHNTNDFLKNYHEARKVGFKNINVDLIFSIPNQSVLKWMNTIKQMIQLQPEHISVYSLIIEENTPLYDMKASGKIKELDDEIDREMYWSAMEVLEANGYNHYEISNLAKESYICQHNMKYWSMNEYIGMGAGAHSYFKGQRFSNECHINKYMENANNNINNKVWQHQNTINDDISEFIFTGLRKRTGIHLEEFEKHFNTSIYNYFDKQIDQMTREKWMIQENNRLMLSNKGLDISNQILSQFILSES